MSEKINDEIPKLTLQFPVDLRDWLAGMALDSHLKWSFDNRKLSDKDCENIAKGCYVIADFMIKEREKTK